MSRGASLSVGEVRQIALAAQGFAKPRPAAVNLGHLRRLLSRLGCVQIDAVNVLVRSHYLSAFSRLGPYSMEQLDSLVFARRGAFEYWGHAASIVDMALYPSLRWRMEHYRAHPNWARFLARVAEQRPGYLDAVRTEIAERGPLSFGQLADPARKPKLDPRYAASTMLWASGSDGKQLLEWFFETGEFAIADRDDGFGRRYDVAERVIPAEVLATTSLDRGAGQRNLVRVATRALGVATVKEIADYFRMPVADTKSRVRELVADGELIECRPDGCPQPGYLHPDARARSIGAAALLSPFDSLLWERDRVQRIFDFRHSFEIYLPEAKRRYGYFVLPFLAEERIQARVDLKADRAGGRLLVRSAYAEPKADRESVAVALHAELARMAAWLGLGDISIARRGDLTPALRAVARR